MTQRFNIAITSVYGALIGENAWVEMLGRVAHEANLRQQVENCLRSWSKRQVRLTSALRHMRHRGKCRYFESVQAEAQLCQEESDNGRHKQQGAAFLHLIVTIHTIHKFVVPDIVFDESPLTPDGPPSPVPAEPAADSDAPQGPTTSTLTHFRVACVMILASNFFTETS